MSHKRLLLFLLVLALLTACTAQAGTSQANSTATTGVEASPAATETVAPTYPATQTLAPTTTALASATALPSPTQVPGQVGPDSYPSGVNPLTGLPAVQPELLDLPPALISVSNFPVTTRPQAGLSKAPFVYEAYFGDGMTRFLAVEYGDLTNVGSQPLTVGPIRSGRLPWEPLRSALGGYLLIANGDESVLAELRYFTNVFSGINDVNSVFVDAAKIKATAQQYQPLVGKPNLKGLAFSPNAPAGGKAGTSLWIPYAFLNQVIWRYDATNAVYNRYQDNYDGVTFVKMNDRLNNLPLTFENVVVVFAYHTLLKAEKTDIALANVPQMPALLFRDGKMYEIFWSTAYANGKITSMRFVDAQGNPVPLKPGHTWVQVVSAGSPYYETVDSKDYGTRLGQKTPGSGAWVVRFIMP
jgi:hypothetical protein